MAYYAFLDENNIVTEVISGIDETHTIGGADPETWYSHFRKKKCKRTSYNTIGGVNQNSIPFRKNYAGIGYTYDEDRDAFIPPKPYPSWILDEQTCLWNAPVAMPTDGKLYRWDEDAQNWVEITAPAA